MILLRRRRSALPLTQRIVENASSALRQRARLGNVAADLAGIITGLKDQTVLVTST